MSIQEMLESDRNVCRVPIPFASISMYLDASNTDDDDLLEAAHVFAHMGSELIGAVGEGHSLIKDDVRSELGLKPVAITRSALQAAYTCELLFAVTKGLIEVSVHRNFAAKAREKELLQSLAAQSAEGRKASASDRPARGKSA